MQYPLMVRIRQQFDTSAILDDVPEVVRRELQRVGLNSKVKAGARVAIAVPSRGIRCMSSVVATVVAELKRFDARPFIVPAMGSHGASTAEGQKRVLESLGIRETTMGAPIRATMEVAEIGRLQTGMPVYMDRYASEADGIIAINRVKPHGVRARHIGSGVMKIIAIGLGKRTGCNTIHTHAFENPVGPYDVIEQVARMAIERTPILLGIGIVENAFAQPSQITVMEPREIPEVERRLFQEAMRLMPRLPTDEIDVLIIEQMGKDVAHSGIDPFVVGDRLYGDPECKPRVKRMVVLDLTPASEGNASGVGEADLITQRLLDKIDREATYINNIASSRLARVKIPMTLPTDREAIEVALATIGPISSTEARVVRIKNTLEIDELFVSQNLMGELSRNPLIQIVSLPEPLRFDESGILL